MNGRMKKENESNERGAQQLIDILQNPEFQKAVRDDTIQRDTDPTKFTLLENISDDAKSDWFTYYKNTDEVLQMNDIQTHARLIPLVFGQSRPKNRIIYNRDRTQKHLDKIQEVFFLHTKDHMRNMSSFRKSQLLALVHAVRNDSGIAQTSKEVVKMFGGR